MITNPELNEKIFYANKILKGDDFSTFRRYYSNNNEQYKKYFVAKFFAVTNENLNYLLKLKLEGKDVLTTTASGDHALNSLLLGAKSVETFDINSIAMYHHELKEVAVKYLSYNEFLQFYSSENVLEKGIYEKLANHLKAETRSFFDAVYNYNKNIMPLIEEFYDINNEKTKSQNVYLKDENHFNELKKILLKINAPIQHNLCSADEVDKYFDEKDVVIYSNILTHYEYNKMDTEPVIKSLSKILKPSGIASIDYKYSEDSKFSPILLENLKSHRFTTNEIRMQTLNGKALIAKREK